MKKMKPSIISLFVIVFALTCLSPLTARAACSNPAGVEGQMMFNVDYHVVQYCDDTDWIAVMERAAFEGGDCINPTRDEAAIIYNEDDNVPQVCIGDWKALGPLNPGAGAGGCSTPSKVEGTVIYNDDDDEMQYCDGSQWVKLLGQPPVDDCISVTTIGGVCPDGTIYAGDAPIGNVRLYTTRCDIGMSWSGAACTGTRSLLPWNNGVGGGYTATGQISWSNGKSNTYKIILVDSNSGVIGLQPHQVAQACADLNQDGYDDWFLPGRSELTVLYVNRVAIGNFDVGGASYSSSSEHPTLSNRAYDVNFNLGSVGSFNKEQGRSLRCTRR